MRHALLLFIGLLAWLNHALADGAAEPIPSFYEEPGKAPNREYVNQHPSEHIDTFTGKLQQHYVDIFIPGNGGFDLKVQRSYSSLGEALPHFSPVGVGWTLHFGKVLRKGNPNMCDRLFNTNPGRNPVMELPDGSRQILYFAPDGRTFLSTRFWQGRCDSGGVLTVFDPQGTRYEMGAPGLNEGPSDADNSNFAFYVSRITDRNGNWMSITYANVGRATAVSGVSTSDGRSLAFSYAGGTLQSITAGDRTWTYVYRASAAMPGQEYLVEVRPPVGAPWRYDYLDSGLYTLPGAASMRSVTYPTGGTITYAYGFVDFNALAGFIPRSTVVTTKATSDGGTWQFAYRPASKQIGFNDVWVPGDRDQVDQTTVTGPDGTRVYWHIGFNSASSGWVYAIGQLVRVTTDDIETRDYGFMPITISNQINVRPGSSPAFDGAIAVAQTTALSTTRNGWGYSVVYSAFDAYGNPSSIRESSSQIKRTDVTYAVDTDLWVLHTKKDETTTNETTNESVGPTTRTFDNRLNLLTENRLGVTTTYSYTPEGDVATRKDAKPSNPAWTFSSYFRGTPRQETHAEGVSLSRTVDAFGNVTSVTDGESVTTSFAYDPLSRITSIAHPLGNPVTIDWTPNLRTLSRGDYTGLVTFDSFGREARTEHRGGSEPVVQTTRYDAAGRAVFKSYPNSLSGTTFEFDALGRTTRSQQPSLGAAGSAERRYRHEGNLVTVTNERGKTTRLHYRTFGDPDQKALVFIEAPEPFASTVIDRDTLGNVTSLNQSGVVRTYRYNQHRFLDAQVDPEIGTTTYGRDEVGNMTSRRVGAQPATTFSYDGLNRLVTTTYASAPAVTRGYYRDDKVRSITTPTATRTYSYDSNKNLTRETVAVSGQTFAIGYRYNANDALDVLTYGSGKTVAYAPDAFGRPTQAAPYIRAVAYHANGRPRLVTYGNGVTSAVELNARQWPSSLFVRGSGQPLFDTTYEYDDGGNFTGIDDRHDSSLRRVLGYDAIDRLVSASGPWGNGSFVYDGRGNIGLQRLGTFAVGYVYDPATDLLRSVNGSVVANIEYDGLGNVTANQSGRYTYDDASNLRCAKCGTAGELRYDYDGTNSRVAQTQAGATTYFIYDHGGRLLWEQTGASNVKEYVYLGNTQVATRVQNATGP